MKAVRLDEYQGCTATMSQHMAEVVQRQGDAWLLQGAGSRLLARQATSCLVTPVQGDRVLVATCGDEAWVLAVLEREAGAPVAFEVEGDLSIGSARGKVSVAGQDGLNLASAGPIAMESPSFYLTTRLAEAVTERLSWVGDRLDARFDGVRFVGRLFDGIVERFSRKARRSYRSIEEVDQVRSGQIDYRADSSLTLKGQNVLAKARELAKIDGGQIHLG